MDEKIPLKSEINPIGNSNKQRDRRDEPPASTTKKIIKGEARRQKRGFGKKFSESFFGDDTRSVADYIIHDILVPAFKGTITDMISGGIEMLMFGERKGRNTYRDRNQSYVSYSSYYGNNQNTQRHSSRSQQREMSRNGRNRHDFDEIILESRGEAEEVLSHLVDNVIDYGVTSVADLYNLVGITPNFTDEKYGWTDMRSASVTRTRGGYLINLPRTQLID